MLLYYFPLQFLVSAVENLEIKRYKNLIVKVFSNKSEFYSVNLSYLCFTSYCASRNTSKWKRCVHFCLSSAILETSQDPIQKSLFWPEP